MNARTHAMRAGLSRGWVEFGYSLRNPQDLFFYLSVGAGALVYLILNRDNEFGDTGLPMPLLTVPGLLGALVAMGAYVGPMYSLAIEREDGTLLRAKAVPHGMTGYVTGQALFQSVSALPMLVIIAVPSAFLFEGLSDNGVGGWLAVLGMTILGLLAVLPIGMIVGSLIKGPNRVGTWGMLPMLAMFGTSGIFYPLSAMWEWLQVVAQVLPVYWIGLGMRAALSPDAAAAAEIGGSWRTLEMLGVLGAWAVVGLLLAPVVLRRMARRQSGSAVEEGRQRAMQRVQ